MAKKLMLVLLVTWRHFTKSDLIPSVDYGREPGPTQPAKDQAAPAA